MMPEKPYELEDGTASAASSPVSTTSRISLRIEELRGDLENVSTERRDYALHTLLSMLWVEAGPARLLVATALCGQPATGGREEASDFARRLCVSLEQAGDTEDLRPPPAFDTMMTWVGNAGTGLLREAIEGLSISLIPAPAEIEHTAEIAQKRLYVQADICLDALRMCRTLGLTAAVDSCVKILRLFPPERVRETGAIGRCTSLLRESASRTLAAFSPDAIYAYWVALGGPDGSARQNLLPALDYFDNQGCIRYLEKLLERAGQWSDGVVVGWFVVRAFHRLGDRRALPALRRIVAEQSTTASLVPWLRYRTSPELAHEARRAIQAIEYGENRLGTGKSDRDSLLRPSHLASEELLRPADETRQYGDLFSHLLRPDERQATGSELSLDAEDKPGRNASGG